MRKKTRTKKTKQKPVDDYTEKVVALVAGVALAAAFGGLAVAFGWKALIVGTPL